MSNRLISRSLLWLLAASASAWLMLSVFEKSLSIAETFLGDPDFPARYGGFLMLVVVLAGFVAMGTIAVGVASGWRGADLFRRDRDDIKGEVDEIREFVGMGSGSG